MSINLTLKFKLFSKLKPYQDINEAIKFIQECIARRYKMSISLRLLCLLSTTYSGIPTKEFNDLKRQFLHTYGYHHILTFFNLSRVGLLIEDTAGTKSNNMLASTASRYLYKRDMFKVKIISLEYQIS